MNRGTHDFQDDPRNRDILIYVNGAMKRRDEAVVSVFDSGFVLGDGVWEGGEILDPDNGKVYRVRLKPLDGGRKLGNLRKTMAVTRVGGYTRAQPIGLQG